MQQIKLLDVGADIELFVVNSVNETVVNAEPYVKGTKYKPFLFDESNKHFSISLDNVLAEFTIPPANNVLDFISYIERGRYFIESKLPFPYKTEAMPCAELHPNELNTDTARTFGCEEDYNPYDGVNPRPQPLNENLRSAGFHVHVKYKGADDYLKINYGLQMDPVRNKIVNVMDLFLGLPSILIEPDNERKTLYGKAGAYRPKPYGLEYRVLSSYFCRDNDLLTWVYNNTGEAVDWLNENVIDEQFENLIKNTINNCDKEQAKKIIIENRIPMPVSYSFK